MTARPDPGTRARLLAALGWTAMTAAAAVALVLQAEDSPLGRAFGVAGGVLLVAVLAGLVVATVNRGLLRRPGRTDLGGQAALALLGAALCPVLTLVIGLVVGRPYELGQLALVLVVAGLYGGLALIALATWRAARRPRLVLS